MRDIVWTIILIWVVWKIYDAFKSVSIKKTTSSSQQYSKQNKEGEVKIEHNVQQKSHFNPNDAEYVDYEEIK